MVILATAGQRHEALMLRKLMEAGAVKRTGRGRPRIRPAAVCASSLRKPARSFSSRCAGVATMSFCMRSESSMVKREPAAAFAPFGDAHLALARIAAVAAAAIAPRQDR